MQYLITFEETTQAMALLDYIKSSGLALNIKAIKSKEELGRISKDAFEVPERTDKELKEMISYSNQRNLGEILKDDDCSDIF